MPDDVIDIPEDSWVHEHEDMDDSDKQTLSKYETRDDALKGSAHATRKFSEYDEKLKNAVNWPTDDTSDEDKEAFNGKIHAYQKVPDSPEGYTIDRSGIPEDIEYDEEMEKSFRTWAHETKATQSVVDRMMKGYTEMMLGRHKAMDEVTKKAEEDYRSELGKEAEIVLGNDKNIGTLRQHLLQLSKDLKMDYKDDDGKPQSHLADVFDFIGKDGMMGDKIPLLKAMRSLLEYRYAQARTYLGDPVKGSTGKGEAFSDDFYANPEGGEKE